MKVLFIILVFFTSFLNKKPDIAEISSTSAFKSGETLKYRLHYGIIDGGLAFLNIEEKVFEGKKVFHAKAYAKTSGMADKLFKVKDIYECYMDLETCRPIKSIKNIKEGNYKQYNEVYYNFPANMAISKRTGEHAIPENIQDVVSSFYYARNSLFKNLIKGQVIPLNTFFDDKIYPLKIRFIGIEVIESEFGKINCLKFSPEVEPGRVFTTKDDLVIWISNDENLVPIRIQMNLIVGSVKCDLVAYEGLRKDLKN